MLLNVREISGSAQVQAEADIVAEG